MIDVPIDSLHPVIKSKEIRCPKKLPALACLNGMKIRASGRSLCFFGRSRSRCLGYYFQIRPAGSLRGVAHPLRLDAVDLLTLSVRCQDVMDQSSDRPRGRRSGGQWAKIVLGGP